MRQKIKNNPFEDLNNSEVKYWLGWLAADGIISENRVALSLKREDRDVIEKFKHFLGNDITIYDGVHHKPFGDFLYSRVSFRNQQVVDSLNELGITNKKSLTLKINFELDWNYLRGFFEGDGCLDYMKKANQSSKRPRIQMCGSSLDHIKQICNFLKKEDIRYCFYDKSKNRKNSHWSIEIVKKSEVYKFLTKLYNNANIYMNRKYFNATQARNSLMSTP